MPENNLKEYLFLLQKPSRSAIEAAAWRARKLNIIVAGRFREHALTILADESAVSRLWSTQLFSHQTSRVVSKTILKKLDGFQLEIAEFWNHRFSKVYIAHKKKQKEHKNISWGKDPLKTPAFYAKYDSERFIKALKVVIKERKLKVLRGTIDKIVKRYDIVWEKDGRSAIVRLIRAWLKKRYHAQLTGILYRLPPGYIKYLLTPELAEAATEVILSFEAGAPCRTLHGLISVGLVYVESAANNIDISLANQNSIMTDIVIGNNWVATQHPTGNLAFVYDIQRVRIGTSNRPNSEDGPDPTYDQYWRDPAMGMVNYNGMNFQGNVNGIEAYKNALINTENADDAVVYFITRFGSSFQAYSSGESHIVISQFEDNWLTGSPDLSFVAAHELLHQYGAMDEYDGSIRLAIAAGPNTAATNVQGSYGATPCNNCDDLGGCDHIPNGNCETCADPFRQCIMQRRVFEMCQYTRGQIGWADIFVEITTSNNYYAGTTDNAFLDIGQQSFQLERNYTRERKKGYRDAYAIFDGGNLTRDQIKRLILRKEEDSSGGGWKVQSIRVFHDCEEIAFDTPIRWLQNDELYYLIPSYQGDDEFVNSLCLRVITGDRNGAGLDGNVTLNIGARIWPIDSSENDFGRNSSRDYPLDPMTNFRVADITSLGITKSSGGDWLLGGIELIVNGDVLFSSLNLNRWFRSNPSSVTIAVNP